MASKISTIHIPVITNQPLNTPGGLGKEIKGHMQGTDVLKRLEDEYRGQMKDGRMFKDDRIETNIVGEHSVKVFLKGKNIHPVGGTNGDGITKTRDFLKDVDVHVIRQLTVESQGDSLEEITFNIILGSTAPPILGTQYTSPQNKTYTTSTVSNEEYIQNIHVTHGHVQAKPLRDLLIQQGKWQLPFRDIIDKVIKQCPTCLPKRVRAAKPQGTLPKAMDFNDIISVDLKELQPEYRKEGYKYILYIVDEFTKLMKGVLIKDKEADTVILALYRNWIIGVNGTGHGAPSRHIYSDNGTEFTSDIGEEFCRQLGIDWMYTPSHSPHSNGSCERNHWTVDRKFEKYVREMEPKDSLQKCLAMAVFAHNNTPKDSGYTPSQLVMGYAPLPPAFMQLDIETIPIPRTRHGCDSHNAREALLAIHETRTKHREYRTIDRLEQVGKNTTSEYGDRQYKPGDKVDFFKNTVNPQRTRGVVIEQIMDRQYKIRYGDDQHTKVATKNMVPVIEQVTEANPVETTVDADDVIEEDTGLTQQPRTENQSMDKDTPGTDYQEEDDWPGSNEVSYSEYPEEQDHQYSDSEDTASIVSSSIDPWDEYQLEIDDPDEPDTAEYFASGGHSGLFEIYFYEVHISRTYK